MARTYNLVMQSHDTLTSEVWQLGKPRPHKPISLKRMALLRQTIAHAHSHGPWRWPDQPVVFISDLHADAQAFESSLRASGCFDASGQITRFGQRARIIIGGDCLDKGPSNLELLRSLKTLLHSGADVTLLAGNHDVRLFVGLQSLLLPHDLEHEHLFLRMGPKVVPLLKEVFSEHMRGRLSAGLPSNEECRARLYPSDDWEERFAEAKRVRLSSEAIGRECRGIRKKRQRFADACADEGMSWQAVYATAMHCQQLFLDPSGEFYWFFSEMQLCTREGSFLFVHAGLDDEMAQTLRTESLTLINAAFRSEMLERPFRCYFGSRANSLRTKYRASNLPLTDDGVSHAYRAGIYAVVHGHRNRTSGQRMMLRQGMLHFEADVTLDRHSRAKEGLSGIGVGLTLIDPSGRVLGLSNDYPRAKVFNPQAILRHSHSQSYHATDQERLSA